MKQLRIHSENNDFQHVETLKNNRTKRQKSREFFVEGVRNINQALARAFQVKAFYTALDAPLSSWAGEILQRDIAERHYLLAPALMAKLSDKHEPSELLAVLGMPEDDLSRIPTPAGARIVVVDRPSNPGNLGTLLRSCDAFQVSGVVVTGHACDLYEPQVLRASMGSFFALPVVRVPSHQGLASWLEQLRGEPHGLRILGTSANAEDAVATESFEGRCLLLFGNETSGLSAAYRAMCDRLLKIPMGGSASSLNISCAASIVLYEAFRTR